MDNDRVAVVAQLVEMVILTPDMRGSNPVIGKLNLDINCTEKRTLLKKQRPGKYLIF